MERHCSPTRPNTGISSDNPHQFLRPNLPYSSPLHLPQHPPPPLPLSDNLTVTATNNTIDSTRNQPDPKRNNNDGASIETQRRPRGRPPGSKNKPKSPKSNPTGIIPNPNQTNQLNDTHRHVLEILNGADVIESIAKYPLRHNTSLRVLHVSGAVANVTIRQSNPHSASTATFPGRFDIMSIAALFVTPSIRSQIPIGAFNDVPITLSVSNGQVAGGFVVGPLMASGSVFVMVEEISSLTYHRLDLEDVNATSSGGGQSPSGMERNGINMPMYSCAGFMPPY